MEIPLQQGQVFNLALSSKGGCSICRNPFEAETSF